MYPLCMVINSFLDLVEHVSIFILVSAISTKSANGHQARGGTTSPHVGCFLLTCHPLFGVGPKSRLVLGNIEGHRLGYR